MDPHPATTGQFARLFRRALSIAAVLPLNGLRRPFADLPYGQFAMRILRKTDLKLRLALRVVALSACCFAAASAYVLFETDRAARSNADWIVGIVAKNLQIQQDRIHWGTIHFSQFPDLQDVATPLMSPGLCIAYRSKNGDTLQRFCSGTPPDQDDAPKLFANLYWTLFNPGREIVRQILFRDEPQGDAVVTVDPGHLIAQAWHETTRLLTVVAITLVCLCILIYLALYRALRPTQVIRVGLERLAANDFTTRLPPFDLAELSSIPDVFNHLAESLDRALSERNALTQRLIAVQDEERRHLARELHDEFGQCLAAISAVATSVGQTARQECPSLLPECQSIARIAAVMMDALRGTLIRLRPPDVDEFGLASSLEGLVAGWNGRSRGRTRFDIELCGNFDSLPSTFGASLYRIAQEAITNAAKHAEATRVKLRLRRQHPGAAAANLDTSAIELTVEDDGKGSSVDIAAKSGMGLLGMRERIAELGGRLSFEARAPAGLILRAIIPAPLTTGYESDARCEA
jgi:signal transduction histidine kinase